MSSQEFARPRARVSSSIGFRARRWAADSRMQGARVVQRLAGAGRWAVALAVGALGAGHGRAQVQGETVAVLELAAPTVQEFILRGTAPLPPGVFPRADGRSPFKIRSADGTLVPAQVERVSSYALTSDGADVVEVMARVRRSSTVAPGSFIRFDVVFDPHVDAPVQLAPRVASLRALPESIVLRTRDVHGNVYRTDLAAGALGRKTLKNGSAHLQERCYDVLRPELAQSGGYATLPRLMGVHSYFSYWANENAVQLDLRIHNGTSGTDRTPSAVLDDVQDKLYFDQLELVVPAGWTILSDFNDPSIGAIRPLANGRIMRPLVKSNADGSLHVIGRQAQFLRRVAIVRDGDEAHAQEMIEERFLGYCRDGVNAQGRTLWSWWNPLTARYFPQRHRLPDLGYMGDVSGFTTTRAKLRADYSRLIDFYTAGVAMNVYPLHFPRLGWAHPWGVGYGGMTGGTEIMLYEGVVTAYAASNDGYRYTLLRHRMCTDRMNDVLFEMNGEPTSVFRWLVYGSSGEYLPGSFYQTQITGPDMIGWGQVPTHQVNAVNQQGLAPAYESTLATFRPVDLQHLVRYTNPPKVLAWLGNDSVAKDDILMQAELARMSYYHVPAGPSGYVLGSSMLGDINWVSNNPGKGFAFGRGEGWMMDVMCAAYSLGTPTWRAQARNWFERVTDVVYNGRVDCTGMIQAIVNTKILNGQYRARQSIEQAIVENALWSMRECVFRGVDFDRVGKLKRVISDSAYTMVGFPAWSAAGAGPWNHVAIGPVNMSQPMFCSSLPSANAAAGGYDKFQTWCTMAYGYELTGDTLFLQRAMQMSGPQFLTFKAAVQSGFTNLENKTALTSLSDIVYP